MELTDEGNARRFESRHGDRVRFCSDILFGDVMIGWLVWNGECWEPNRKQAIEMMKETVLSIVDEAKALELQGKNEEAELTFKWAMRSQSNARIMSALRLAAEAAAASYGLGEKEIKTVLIGKARS